MQPRLRNYEWAVGAVHHVHNVAGFGKVSRLLYSKEGRSGRGSAVRISSRRAHVVSGGKRRCHVAKQGTKRSRKLKTDGSVDALFDLGEATHEKR